MKRSTSVLSTALLGAGLIVSAGRARAQVNGVYTLVASGTPVAAGDTVTFSVFLKVTGAQFGFAIRPNLAFNSTYFFVDDTAGDPKFNAATGSGQTFGSTSVLRSSSQQDVPQTLLGNFVSTGTTLTVVSRATGVQAGAAFDFSPSVYIGNYKLVATAAFNSSVSTDVGFVNAMLPFAATVGSTASDAIFRTTATGINTSISVPTLNLTFNNGVVHYGPAAGTPGPDALAVFAMGGLAPVAAAFRRRRAKKA